MSKITPPVIAFTHDIRLCEGALVELLPDTILAREAARPFEGRLAQLGHRHQDNATHGAYIASITGATQGSILWAPEIGRLALRGPRVTTGRCSRALHEHVVIRLWEAQTAQ